MPKVEHCQARLSTFSKRDHKETLIEVANRAERQAQRLCRTQRGRGLKEKNGLCGWYYVQPRLTIALETLNGRKEAATPDYAEKKGEDIKPTPCCYF